MFKIVFSFDVHDVAQGIQVSFSTIAQENFIHEGLGGFFLATHVEECGNARFKDARVLKSMMERSLTSFQSLWRIHLLRRGLFFMRYIHKQEHNGLFDITSSLLSRRKAKCGSNIFWNLQLQLIAWYTVHSTNSH